MLTTTVMALAIAVAQFGAPTTVSTTGGVNAVSCVVADLDLDGSREVVAVISDVGVFGLELFENNGSGTLSSAGSVTAPAGATELRYIALADVDGDGDLDAIVSCQGVAGAGGDGICVFLNNSVPGGPITFSADAFYATTNIDPGKIAVGQFDGVNGPDIAVASFDIATPENDVCILLHAGGGAGAFYGAGVNLPVTGATLVPVGISAADLDADGDLDLAVGRFDASAFPPVVDGGIELFTNSGAGVFTPAGITAIPGGANWPAEVRAMNLDGAGFVDVSALRYDSPFVAGTQQLVPFINTPALTLTAVAGSPFGPGDGATAGSFFSLIEPMDFDNDTDQDIVVNFPSGNIIRAFAGDGTGAFPTSATFATGGFPTHVASGDLDCNTFIDVVVCDTTANGIMIYMNTGGTPGACVAPGGGGPTTNTRGGGGSSGFLPCSGGAFPVSGASGLLALLAGLSLWGTLRLARYARSLRAG